MCLAISNSCALQCVAEELCWHGRSLLRRCPIVSCHLGDSLGSLLAACWQAGWASSPSRSRGQHGSQKLTPRRSPGTTYDPMSWLVGHRTILGPIRHLFGKSQRAPFGHRHSAVQQAQSEATDASDELKVDTWSWPFRLSFRNRFPSEHLLIERSGCSLVVWIGLDLNRWFLFRVNLGLPAKGSRDEPIPLPILLGC